VVRSRLSPGSLAAKLKSAIAAVDPMLSVANFRSMDDLRRLSTRDQRYQSALFVSVAGLALLLSVIGLYGIVTRSVTQRTREVGIRMALGADVWDSIWAILRPALAYAAAGLALGLLFSAAASHLLRHLIWGIAPDDPLTFVVSSAILVFCALIASVIPAARVTHINPVETLRYE
jgi:ABC-type antimicrobial peptide transport system permease subunit